MLIETVGKYRIKVRCYKRNDLLQVKVFDASKVTKCLAHQYSALRYFKSRAEQTAAVIVELRRELASQGLC